LTADITTVFVLPTEVEMDAEYVELATINGAEATAVVVDPEKVVVFACVFGTGCGGGAACRSCT